MKLTIVLFGLMFASHARAANGARGEIECISRIWVHGLDAKNPAAEISVRGPSHSGLGVTEVIGHPELEYEIHQNTADHSPGGAPVPYHYSIASGPHHVGIAAGTIEGENTLRLDIVTGHKGSPEPGCKIEFYNVICASSRASLDKALEADPPMKTPKLETLPKTCIF